MSSIVISAIEFVGVTNVIIAVAVSLVVCWFLRVNYSMMHFNLPPGPPAIPYPFDCLLAFVPKKDRFGHLVALCRRYGDMVSLRVGKKMMLLVSGPDVVKDLLVKRADVTSDREIVPFFKYAMGYTGGLLFSHGETWQERRRFTLSSLRNLGMGKGRLERRIKDEARIFCDALAQFVVTSTPFEPTDHINAAISNIICGITFGRRFEYDDPVFRDMIERLRSMITHGEKGEILNDLGRVFPVLLKSPLFRAPTENLRGLQDIILKEVTDHEETFDPNDIRDIIDMYLVEARRLETSGEKSYLTPDSIWTCVFDLFLAGTETTSTTLTWFLLFMVGHPDIQAKIAHEIDQVIGRERAPSVDDRKNMPFTDATLTEVMRFRPIAPVGIPHLTACDIHYQGYTIPKNTDILLNILAMHLDPRLWDNPEVFNPTRFLSEDGKTVLQKEAFFSFGIGRRVCLGEQLARTEFFIFASSLLQRFTFHLPNDVTADYSFDHCTGTLGPKKYHVILRER